MKNVEIFDPAKMQYQLVGLRIPPRFSYKAIALDNGRVALFGEKSELPSPQVEPARIDVLDLERKKIEDGGAVSDLGSVREVIPIYKDQLMLIGGRPLIYSVNEKKVHNILEPPVCRLKRNYMDEVASDSIVNGFSYPKAILSEKYILIVSEANKGDSIGCNVINIFNKKGHRFLMIGSTKRFISSHHIVETKNGIFLFNGPDFKVYKLARIASEKTAYYQPAP